MSITGYLREFSLPELFQFLEQGQKTGLLTINALLKDDSPTGNSYYIWFREGSIVAAANQLEGKGLASLILQRKWHTKERLVNAIKLCPKGTPWGLCLKSQGLLDSDHLKILFSVQVLRQVCKLFELINGAFVFDSDSPLCLREMTGLSTPANEVILSGLRNLKVWDALEDKLPAPTSGLLSRIEGKPKISLNKSEWRIWEYTDSSITVEKIAEQLDIDVAKTQQIAFRLIVTGLLEEIPMLDIIKDDQDKHNLSGEEESLSLNQQQAESLLTSGENKSNPSDLSDSFLENLMGFLQNKL